LTEALSRGRSMAKDPSSPPKPPPIGPVGPLNAGRSKMYRHNRKLAAKRLR
jgi:hypothetical protein